MKNSLIKSTGIVAVSTLASRIMGFARDMVMAGIFGASGLLDGFFIAFTIPNIFRRFVAEGTLTISFVPVYTEYLMNNSKKEALELAQKTMSILLLTLMVIISLGIIFSPEIIKVIGYGFKDINQINLTISLNRIMFPYLFFVSLVAFSMGYLNSHKYFFAPAFAPVLLNVGIITGALFFRHYFEEPIYGLAFGVLLGGILQLLLQIPYMIKAGFKLRISIDFNHPGIKKIFLMVGPALFGIAIYQINILMIRLLGSMLPSGSISYLYYSDRMTELVMGVFIVSIGNVILPELSGYSANGDYGKIRNLYLSSIKSALFLSIPASIALMVIGLPVISVLFMRGEFTPSIAELTYKALLYASIGTASLSIIRITVPTFYSLKDTKTPVYASLVSFIINISFGYILMQTGLKHAGLTLALSIATIVQMFILVILLQKKIGKIDVKSLLLSISKLLFSGIIMAVLIWLLANQLDWLNSRFILRMGYLILIIILGASAYFIICTILKVDEVKYFKEAIIRRIKR